jgi:hypothetical protein
MIRRFSFVSAVLLVSGCHDVPADRSRLAEGQMASVYGVKSASIMLDHLEDGTGQQAEPVVVEVGTRVMILEDAGVTDGGERLVLATPREGVAKGVLVRILRASLRPL